MKKAKAPQLRARYCKPDRFNDPDLVASGDAGIPRSHMHLVIHRLGQPFRWIDGTTSPSLFDELQRLGYDMSTFRFSCRKAKK